MSVNIKVRALRSDLAAILSRVEDERERVVIHRHHDPVAVLVSVDELRELDEMRRVYTLRAGRRLLA